MFASLALPTLKLVPLLSPPTRNTEHHIEQGSTNSTDINIVDLTIMSEVNVVQNIRAALHKELLVESWFSCNGWYRDAEDL